RAWPPGPCAARLRGELVESTPQGPCPRARWPFTCRAPLPATALAWYLDGRPHQPDSLAEPGAPSTFTLPARRADRQLTCALAPAVPGATDASVHFDVAAPGLLVVLLAPVQANPPAAITWLGPDGRPVVNTSLLAPDANGHPALTNHTVHLSALPGTFSVHATNGLGVANASIPAPGLWDARVELPLLGVAAGVAVVLGALLGLGCVAARRHAKPGTGKGRRPGPPLRHRRIDALFPQGCPDPRPRLCPPGQSVLLRPTGLRSTERPGAPATLGTHGCGAPRLASAPNAAAPAARSCPVSTAPYRPTCASATWRRSPEVSPGSATGSPVALSPSFCPSFLPCAQAAPEPQERRPPDWSWRRARCSWASVGALAASGPCGEALLCGCSADRSTCPLGAAGFVRLPATGYIYKVSSTSSDEIWL
uniref:Transmembrane protein 25 n=1 Tax=Nothoprocta perdicaria TaxID=30464 RepID=A0A8C6YTG3_NOTPE